MKLQLYSLYFTTFCAGMCRCLLILTYFDNPRGQPYTFISRDPDIIPGVKLEKVFAACARTGDRKTSESDEIPNTALKVAI